LVSDVKPQIDRLFARLKQIVRPQVQRDIYQKRGRMMSNLVSRSYVNSLMRPVTNIHVQNTLKLEKEKVNIGMLIDYSGSVSRQTALEITTILTETFGNYVEDYGFSIGAFAEDNQYVKRFFEPFNNTRCRIPNISVNSCGTRLHDLLESMLKQMNAIHEERRKILVVASDFQLSDTDDCERLLELYAKAGIEIILFGFDNSNVRHVFNKVKAKRIDMEDIHDLPELFIQIYIDAVKF